MNSNKEIADALKHMKTVLSLGITTGSLSAPQCKAYSAAIDALNKQIGRKPYKETGTVRLCPSCDSRITFDALNSPEADAPAYCNACGQRLEWAELMQDDERKRSKNNA